MCPFSVIFDYGRGSTLILLHQDRASVNQRSRRPQPNYGKTTVSPARPSAGTNQFYFVCFVYFVVIVHRAFPTRWPRNTRNTRNLPNKSHPQISQIFTETVDLRVSTILETLSNLWIIPFINRYRRA